MISPAALLARLKPTSTPVDTRATVSIGVSRGCLLWRLVGPIAMVAGAAYSLVRGALIYNGNSGDPSDLRFSDVTSFVHAYSVRTMADVFDVAERTRAMSFHAWPMYAFGISALVLIVGLWSAFRIFARMQSSEPSVVVSPTGVRLLHDVSRRSTKTIPWSEIAAVRGLSNQQHPVVVLYVRDPARFLEPRTWLQSINPFAGESKAVIHTYSLDMRAKKLKALLDAYVAAYGTVAATR